MADTPIVFSKPYRSAHEIDNLTYPPIIRGAYLVATYHTHPRLIADGGDPDPSPDDIKASEESGVPWFIVTEVGLMIVGPERRVGGLTGPVGYPS